MKREFVSIRYSDFPKDYWQPIVLINPSECSNICIPNKGLYLVYKAYFPTQKEKRLFNIVFPKAPFEREISAIHPSKRKNLTTPVQFEFMKCRGGSMKIKNWVRL